MAHNTPSKKLVETLQIGTLARVYNSLKENLLSNSLNMQFFLTLLASVASLSAYTPVGVHASSITQVCAACPPEVAKEALTYRCVDTKGNTICRYQDEETRCYYDGHGERIGKDFSGCPGPVKMSNWGCEPNAGCTMKS
ncbi:hypothetical protein PAXINDRAFT_12656 [Paxillus involutus ATCC 200175]|uniref:Uncharacterized protein n=1 Tax=Paxillus involutus ATCC 200175 TaxID=664439 RepID=A0A0C9SXQ5_PAXIN|nr:hypothetical protein PAXINDRAFT_12656 [Paxillus involutus ATCC 200175]